MPHRHNPPQDRLLETLSDAEPATVPELAAALGEHPATVERRCWELQRAGVVRQCTGGRYTLAVDAGDGSTAAD